MGLEQWKRWAKALKREILVLYLACKDRRTPWYAKVIGVCVVGYALSPIDLIPDPIPIIGYLDDLIIVPLGILLFRSLVPNEVLADCRRIAEANSHLQKPRNWIAAAIIIAIWVSTAVFLGAWLWRRVSASPYIKE